MKPTSTTRRDHLDWNGIKDRVDLASVATGLLGPAPKKSGRRLLWHCPFHDDRDPSFEVDPKTQRWKCWPCDRGGDAPALVMALKGSGSRRRCDTSPTGRGSSRLPGSRGEGRMPRRRRAAPAAPARRRHAPRRPVDGGGRGAGRGVGGPALDARGPAGAGLPGRGTRAIRADDPPTPAGLGAVGLPAERGRDAVLAGERHHDPLVRLGPPEPGEDPPARGPQAAICPGVPHRPTIYPGRESIRQDVPLIAVEGEFDAMLLDQELGDLAGVFTYDERLWPDRPADGGGDDRRRRALVRRPRRRRGRRRSRRPMVAPGRPRPAPRRQGLDRGPQAGIDLRLWWVESHFPAEFDREERAAIVEFS